MFYNQEAGEMKIFKLGNKVRVAVEGTGFDGLEGTIVDINPKCYGNNQWDYAVKFPNRVFVYGFNQDELIRMVKG